jgi:catechol 2,3-dioxygenase-like lactoylglutathione lyase family enzyme
MLEQLSPILPSGDIPASERFYAALGFETIYIDADYLLMKREGAEIHFFLKAGHDPYQNDHGAYLRPSDIDAFSAEVEGLGLPRTGMPRFHPVEAKAWNMRECALLDPDGNLIRAGQEN